MRPCRSRMPNCRLWKGRICREHLDDLLRVGALLQLLEHEHLVLVRAVDAGLAGRHAFAGHDDGLDAHEELIVAIDAGRRRNDHAAGAAIDGDDRPRRQRGRRRCEKRIKPSAIRRMDGNDNPTPVPHLLPTPVPSPQAAIFAIRPPSPSAAPSHLSQLAHRDGEVILPGRGGCTLLPRSDGALHHRNDVIGRFGRHVDQREAVGDLDCPDRATRCPLRWLIAPTRSAGRIPARDRRR